MSASPTKSRLLRTRGTTNESGAVMKAILPGLGRDDGVEMDALDYVCDLARVDAMGLTYFTCRCIDCGMNTAPVIWRGREAQPAMPNSYELFWLKDSTWAKTGLGECDGTLCILCVENRIGRRLKPKDFDHANHYNSNSQPRPTPLLKSRRG
jgi:hypothetical protein